MARVSSRTDKIVHAIFGGGPARFVSASSLGAALVALGAKVNLVSASGSRDVPVEEFFIIPKTEEERDRLKPGEILTEILIPSANGGKNTTYRDP